MTDQTEKLEDQTEASEIEALEPDETQEGETPEVEAEADAETVVTFGDDEPEEAKEMPNWVKDLRKRNRDLNKDISALQKQIDAGKAEEDTALGAEPTLEDCDYDADKYRDSLREWDKGKARNDAKVQSAQAEQESQSKAYQAKLSDYHEGKSAFDADSFDEAEGAVKDALTETQQGIIIQAFGSKAATLISGLGHDEKRLKELAGISDPIAFTVAVTRLETAMKVSQRKPKTAPETRISGDAATANIGDKQLEKLREAAAKTGDMSAVLAYKRRLKAS